MSERKPNAPVTWAFETRDEDDAPELTSADLNRRTVTWRLGDTVVSPEVGRQAMRRVLVGKTRVNMHLDNDVIAYFRNIAGGRGYQTLINSALRSVME
jgi:uncharacterized protein (DUF4415 family)